MKDQRIKVFRGALEGLIESLDALVRVSRWSEPDPPPDPLRSAASKLMDRLGTAGRLSSGTFVGTPADTNKVEAMITTMRRQSPSSSSKSEEMTTTATPRSAISRRIA